MTHFRTLAGVLLLTVLAAAEESSGIAGAVFDSTTGQPVRQAQVTVEGGFDKKILTDTDGKYKIDLPAVNTSCASPLRTTVTRQSMKSSLPPAA